MSRVTLCLVAAVSVIFAAPAAWAGPIEDLQPGQWYEVPNSRLDTVLPSPIPPGSTGPASIMIAWSGGAYDTQRNRLIVTGGGHADYGGNEIYAFDIATLRWSRIWGPSPNIPQPGGSCNQTYSDGNPCARHTYDGLEYLPNQDRFFLMSGSLYCGGGGPGSDTWTFGLGTGAWTRRADMPSSAQLELTTAYDPVTGHLFACGPASTNDLMEYDPVANTWTMKGSDGAEYGRCGAIDPVRRRYVVVGDNKPCYMWDLAASGTAPRQTVSTTGDKTMEATRYPGIDFDPVSNLLVAWGGGADVYTLDLTSKVWTKRVHTGTVVPTAPPSQGTYGRFRYIPSKNVFIVVNKINENVFFYKLAPGGGPSDTTSPNAPASLHVK